ncbi:MAG: ferrous iron transport protein A [Bacteroidales bacterium]|nr:ferrous iron transport protein A [Bacteroidales bacterium]
MDNKQGITSLADIKDGQSGIIVSILGGRILTKRLSDLGLNSGTEVKIIGRTLFSGPIQIEVSGSRLVIGEGLASKIIVQPK